MSRTPGLASQLQRLLQHRDFNAADVLSACPRVVQLKPDGEGHFSIVQVCV